MEGNSISAFQTQETQFSDTECLIKALADVGYNEVEVHDAPKNLYGYHGDVRQEVAHVIIRRKFIGGASNDIGFVRNSEGKYQAIISDYDRRQHGSNWLLKLTDAYSEHGTIKQAARMGLRFLGKTKVEGKVQLKFMQRG